MPLLFKEPPRTILVVCTRRIGDVLLATPLVRSLKIQWPQSQIDMLVFRGTEAALENNRDVRRVIVVAQRAALRERITDAARIWRRYDLACAAGSSDRSRFYTWFAGRKRIGLVDPERVTRLTRFMLHRIALNQYRDVHTVTSTLALAPLVDVVPHAEVVAPGISHDNAQQAQFDARLNALLGTALGQPMAVLHLCPMYTYKQWHIDGWVKMTRWLHTQGFVVVFSGGPAQTEKEYADQVIAMTDIPIINLVGQLTLGETAQVIRRARLFIGPDTSVTHIAAACGTPTIALFGPSDPVRWGPWPYGWQAGNEPWPLRGSGRRGNVYLLQGEQDCVPCKLEGCDRHVKSFSQCLMELDVQRVIAAATVMLDLASSRHAQGLSLHRTTPQLSPAS